MPVAPLTGPALASAIDLATAVEDGHQVLFYLGPQRGALDETAITRAWLPGSGWADRTGEILLSAGATVAHDGTGHEITFTVADESRTEWRDDLAVAVIARHWFPASSAWGGWCLVAWGYLDGSDRQRLGQGLDQTGERTVTYAGYWPKARVAATRLGRRNLATSATIVAASPVLLTPAAEAPLEYVSQDDCTPQKAIDGNVDTVSIADVIADPAVPTIGDTTHVRFLRVGGPFTRGVAAGGEPRYAELWYGHNLTPWGTTWSGIPGMYAEGTAPVRDEPGHVKTEVVTYGDGTKGFRVTTYQGAINSWIQWIVGGQTGIPMRAALEIKAGNPFSIDKRIHSLSLGDASAAHTQRMETALALSQDWQRYEFVFDADEHSPGGKIEITTEINESAAGDLIYEIRNLEVSEGYSDNAYAIANGSKRLFLCGDNGAGGQFCQRIEFDLTAGVEDWRIPAFGSVIVTDDIPTFKARFGDTGHTLLQMKGRQPGWFWSPGVGKMKLAYATDPSRFNYNDPSLELVEEIDFAVANGGVPWLASQALRRGDGTGGSPIGTGIMIPEDFPHTGLLPTGGYGAAYWWLDLNAYQASKLRLNIDAGAMRIPVDDVDAYTDQGLGTFTGGERAWWIGKDADALLVQQRGISGTTAAAHNAGDTFTPDGFGGTWQNNATKQTGWNVDQLTLRRKPGTPMILAGAVLYSDQIAPGDPSTGGQRWENHLDWTLLQRWSDRQGNPDVITINLAALLGGPREMRHIIVVIDKMARDASGNPQRAKLNEIVVLEARLGAGATGNWASKDASDLGGALGWLLTQRAGMPAAKVALALAPNGQPVPTPAIGDLPIAPTTAAQAIQSLAASGLLRVWLDAANGAVIDAAPTSAAYSPTQPYFTLDTSTMTGDVSLTWSAAHAVSQVNITAREAASLRTYSASFPSQPAGLGEVVEIRDVLVRSASDVYAIAEAEWRSRNARRLLSTTTGALPWLEVNQRLLLVLPEIDAGGNAVGVNVSVKTYRIQIGIDDGGVTWETSLELPELAV